jgi:hypothetical protein
LSISFHNSTCLSSIFFNLFTILLAFLPYCPYLFTIQLALFLYFPNLFTIRLAFLS